jgi:hypothetical protein
MDSLTRYELSNAYKAAHAPGPWATRATDMPDMWEVYSVMDGAPVVMAPTREIAELIAMLPLLADPTLDGLLSVDTGSAEIPQPGGAGLHAQREWLASIGRGPR